MKKRWNFLTVILILMMQIFGVTASHVFAQAKEGVGTSVIAPEERKRRHVLYVTPESSYTAGLDEGYSLFPRDGLGLGGQIGYDYRGRVVVNEFSLGGKYILLDAPYKLRERDMGIHVRIADRVLFPINLRSVPLTLYVGGAVRMDLNVWFPDDRLNASFQNSLVLDAIVRLEWNIQKSHSIRAGIGFSLLGVSWRPAWAFYTTAVERNLSKNGILGPLFMFPKFASVHNLQSFMLDIRYTWHATKLINLFADYSYFFLNDTSARPYKFIDNIFGIGVEFKL